MECDVFERIRDWLNTKLPLYQWASFYDEGVTGAHFGAEKNETVNIGHIPIWLNYEEIKQ